MNFSKCRTVVFDFDGTLVDSAHLKTWAYFEVLKEVQGVEPILRNTLAKNASFTRQQVFESVQKSLSDSRDLDVEHLVERYAEVCRSSVAGAPEIDGATEFLEWLHNQGKSLYVSSATPERELLWLLGERSFSKYIERAYGAPQTKNHHIRKILKRENVDPRRLLYIGDSLADFSAARSEGCEFVGVDGSDELGNLDCLVVANLSSLLLRFSNDATRKA